MGVEAGAGSNRSRVALIVVGTAAVSTVVSAVAVAVVARLWNTPTLAQRRTIWNLVWERIMERPLGGYGFTVFWDDPELIATHELLHRGSAHNSLMETGLGLGLLGTVPFVVIVLLAVWNAGRDLWNRPNSRHLDVGGSGRCSDRGKHHRELRALVLLQLGAGNGRGDAPPGTGSGGAILGGAILGRTILFHSSTCWCNSSTHNDAELS